MRSGYVFGFNGIEKTNEVAGVGNHYTAEFGEYDPRRVGRWNTDPKPNPSVSPYAMFGGNPISNSDVALDSPSTWNRVMGALQGIGGTVEAAVGGVGGVVTAETGIGAVVGYGVMVHGADNAAAGFTQMWTGEQQTTFTERAVSGGLQAVGVSEQNANTTGALVNMGLSLTAGAAYKAPAVDGTFVASKPVIQVVKVEAKSLSAQGDDLVKLNGGKNSLTLRTPLKQIRFDLAGKAHGTVPTPHMQIYNKHFLNGVQKSVTRDSKAAIPMGQKEIRMIRKYLEGLK